MGNCAIKLNEEGYFRGNEGDSYIDMGVKPPTSSGLKLMVALDSSVASNSVMLWLRLKHKIVRLQ